jgi:phospholipid/cholesterol/gamma-HCH transport system substrate-binding protein
VLEEVLGRLQSGEGTLGKLSTDEALYQSMDDAARSIQQAATEIATLVVELRENPKKFVQLSLF